MSWTPERQAEHQRTLAMIRRSAERQAEALPDGSGEWASRALGSGLVIAVPQHAVRRGDLIVRNADGSLSSLRLIARDRPHR